MIVLVNEVIGGRAYKRPSLEMPHIPGVGGYIVWEKGATVWYKVLLVIYYAYDEAVPDGEAEIYIERANASEVRKIYPFNPQG